jgi:hypothetical protein
MCPTTDRSGADPTLFITYIARRATHGTTVLLQCDDERCAVPWYEEELRSCSRNALLGYDLARDFAPCSCRLFKGGTHWNSSGASRSEQQMLARGVTTLTGVLQGLCQLCMGTPLYKLADLTPAHHCQ